MAVLFVYLLAVVVFVFIALCLCLHSIHKKYAHIPGPPLTSFFLGHVPQVKEAERKGIFLMALVGEWMLEYGHTLCLFFSHRPMVVTVDPVLVKEVLVTGGHPKSPTHYNPAATLFGERFLQGSLHCTIPDEIHGRRRKYMELAFKKGALNSYVEDINNIADVMVAKLSQHAGGSTMLVMAEEFCAVAVDILFKVGFHQDVHSITTPDCPFRKSFQLSFKGLNAQLAEVPFEKYLPLNKQLKQESRQAVRFLRETVWEWIKKRKADINQGNSVPLDILTCIIQAAEDKFWEMKETSIDESLSFSIAGEEESSKIMAFTLLELGRHPDVLNRVYSEVDEVLGSQPHLSVDQLSQLKYLTAVLKETMRLHSAVVFTMRCLKCDVMSAAGIIPKGTDVMVNMYAMGRMPELFPDPLKFDPDRFLMGEDSMPYTQIPFSIGSRSCIGQKLAMMEMKIVLAMFLRSFNFTLDPNQSFAEVLHATLSPKDGARMTLTLRHKYDK